MLAGTSRVANIPCCPAAGCKGGAISCASFRSWKRECGAGHIAAAASLLLRSLAISSASKHLVPGGILRTSAKHIRGAWSGWNGLEFRGAIQNVRTRWGGRLAEGMECVLKCCTLGAIQAQLLGGAMRTPSSFLAVSTAVSIGVNASTALTLLCVCPAFFRHCTSLLVALLADEGSPAGGVARGSGPICETLLRFPRSLEPFFLAVLMNDAR